MDKVDKPLSKPRWMVLLAVFLSVLSLAAGGLAYTSYVDGRRAAAEREADRRWCDLLVTLDDAYGSGTPTTALGRRVAEAVHKLRVELEC